MDPDKTLDNFRKDWRSELAKKTSGKKSVPLDSGSDSSVATRQGKSHPDHELEGQSSLLTLDDRPVAGSSTNHEKFEITSQTLCNKCSQNQSKKTKESTGVLNYLGSNEDTERTLTYYPFNIVHNLLNKSNPSKGSGNDERSVDRIKYRADKCCLCGGTVDDVRGLKRSLAVSKDSNKYVKERIEDVFKRKRTNSDDFSKESLLDQFLLDLNEIDEIPFFDITLPREVAVKIFQHLDIKDLCRCSQASRSWRSLADDELLWCNLCHSLGYEQNQVTRDRGQWKAIVRENITKDKQILSNWKNRTGNQTSLQYVQGGILCAVNSHNDTVVAGYSNGDVKMWDLDLEESCTLKPSNRSLLINEGQDEGIISVEVSQLEVTPTLAVASYKQGNIDIWRLKDENNINPTFTLPREAKPNKFCVAKSCDMVVTGNSMDVNVYTYTNNGFHLHSMLNRYSGKQVSHLNMLEVGGEEPQVFITTLRGELYLHRPGETAEEMREYTDNQDQLYTSGTVGCVDVRVDPALVAVGHATIGTVYDIETAKALRLLTGHMHIITCLNLVDSPPYQLVTGSMDRRLRIFDLRTDQAATVLSGHTSFITTAQMDDWKVVSGDDGGFVCVWDRRMSTRLWEWHNRHPVRYCHFYKQRLIAGNVPGTTKKLGDDHLAHRRFRGSLHVCDFSADQTTQDLPEICHSTYDEPEAYNYNIRLAVPYDNI
ncbi:F-box/WD repeat-containing protein 8-like [Mizuhopecten yessoensis]|uniref:F-box/WD repeat-containing protein 8 n=1 Tax=Mizuhopecten yessoensis TaxID=6573 RepID=A0A210PYS4_MIZYE|nr:F-box/WD repeat-containing protein 8-like [Mizuhopecten yessoensis]OWF41589.1 F-box/WD repeat-containing protein 8 [Mizuhopecten yessoensis]